MCAPTFFLADRGLSYFADTRQTGSLAHHAPSFAPRLLKNLCLGLEIAAAVAKYPPLAGRLAVALKQQRGGAGPGHGRVAFVEPGRNNLRFSTHSEASL